MEQQLSLDNILIVFNEDVANSIMLAQFTFDSFLKKGYKANLCSSYKLDINASLVVAIGGDGTLLRCARFFAPYNVPILGINIGRLGFLAQVNANEIDSCIEKLIAGKYKIEQRMMLSAQNNSVLALNDIVIKGDSFSRTSKLFLSINDKTVCDYLADGIIVSTPTGSTAYTLSAGGPVIVPEIDAMVIVPICAHTLTARPLVIPSGDVVKIISCDNCNNLKLSADGQNTVDVKSNDFVEIKKSHIVAKLVVLEKDNNDFYSILREKLQWGVSPERNV